MERSTSRYIFWLQAGGFAAMAGLIWLDELFDLPHLFFGATPTPRRLEEAVFESAGIVLLGVVVLVWTNRVFRHVAYLESLVVICAWCRKVRMGDEWMSLETFLSLHRASTSHGVCPSCEPKMQRRA